MKKLLVSSLVMVGFFVYVVWVRTDKSENGEMINVIIPSIVPEQTGKYKNGEYVGNVVDALYGSVEVKIVVKRGDISEVEFLQYPHHHSYSLTINPEALPFLQSEAIRVQSAEVDTFTGATQTSRAFRESLQSALDQAI
jgi:uncharacterized protein with FMN-binding domain